jgi:hypothetical protein
LDEIVAQKPDEEGTTLPSSNGGLSRAEHHRELSVEGKRVTVETGVNKRGSYVKLVDSGSNSAVIMPWAVLPEMIAALQQLYDTGEPVAPPTPTYPIGSTTSITRTAGPGMDDDAFGKDAKAAVDGILE